MRYIILCGSNHDKINGTPRQLVKIGGERVLDRTIRLLRKNGVKDIYITATDPAFDLCNAEVIHYESSGPWINCFYLTDEPTTYIFGDVYFSPEAIETIVNTQTDDIEFFASAPPFSRNYP
jgi:NDP-sugar pyrophosphorylase family protein